MDGDRRRRLTGGLRRALMAYASASRRGWLQLFVGKRNAKCANQNRSLPPNNQPSGAALPHGLRRRPPSAPQALPDRRPACGNRAHRAHARLNRPSIGPEPGLYDSAVMIPAAAGCADGFKSFLVEHVLPQRVQAPASCRPSSAFTSARLYVHCSGLQPPRATAANASAWFVVRRLMFKAENGGIGRSKTLYHMNEHHQREDEMLGTAPWCCAVTLGPE